MTKHGHKTVGQHSKTVKREAGYRSMGNKFPAKTSKMDRPDLHASTMEGGVSNSTVKNKA